MNDNCDMIDKFVLFTLLIGALTIGFGIMCTITEKDAINNFYSSRDINNGLLYNITVEDISDTEILDTNGHLWLLDSDKHVQIDINNIKKGSNIIIITKDIYTKMGKGEKYTLIKLYKINGETALSWQRY